jgi:hypothetical protein
MTIIREHIPYYREIFSFPDFWREKFLMIGLPYIEGTHLPADFTYRNLKELVLSHGLQKVFSADLFDTNADYRWDLNRPIPKNFQNRYKVLIDIGTLEHIFDTRQCLENYFRLVAPGGLFVLVTPVNGYFGHGLHVFNPETLLDALEKNDFLVLYKKFITSTGIEVSDPALQGNILLWVLARKGNKLGKFIIPQQGYWKNMYASKKKYYSDTSEKTSVIEEITFYLNEAKSWVLRKLPVGFRTWIYRRSR